MIEFAIAHINPALFKEQLNAALGYGPPLQVRKGPETMGMYVITFGDELDPGDETVVQNVIDAHDPAGLSSNEQTEKALRDLVVAMAQSAVGVSITALDPGQTRALLAIVLWKQGAVDADGMVRPLAEWATG